MKNGLTLYQSLFFSVPIVIGIALVFACKQSGKPKPETVNASLEAKSTAKTKVPRQFGSHLCPDNPDTLPFFFGSVGLSNALTLQANYLIEKNTPQQACPGFDKSELLETVQTLRSLPFFDFKELAHRFDFYCLNANGCCDRVRVTGYYTPAVQASHTQSAEFHVPLLEKPDNKSAEADTLVSRGGGIAGKPLAWVRTEKELKNAQLQGSCLVQFQDGRRQFLGFGGSTPHAGSKYVYFTKVGDKVLGAGSFPMTAGHSLAVDPKVAPLGAVLFAELPDMDASGRLRGYTYRIVLAQDRGGAIKSCKRVDLYSGIGQQGLAAARKINQFGRLWVMLPRR